MDFNQPQNQLIPTNPYEQQISNVAFARDFEKTKYDKLLAQSEMQRLRELVSKELFDINDISEIMNILVSTEVKLTNFNENDRYVLGKYLIWVTEYAKRYSTAIRAKDQYQKMWSTLSKRHKELRIEIEKLYAETFKQSIHCYCFLARSPLSIGGSLVKTMTTDRSEMEYKGMPVPQAQPKQGMFGG
jgi:hypothetical protein